jgi:transcriptional regulator with XRE-family HTH domain
MKLISFDEVRAEALAKPAVKAEYDRLGPAFVVAEAVVRARKAAGLTQAQLAERMGAAQPFIARIESAKTIPSISTMVRIASATGTTFAPTFVGAGVSARRRRPSLKDVSAPPE